MAPALSRTRVWLGIKASLFGKETHRLVAATDFDPGVKKARTVKRTDGVVVSDANDRHAETSDFTG
jgi:hypothetical protein